MLKMQGGQKGFFLYPKETADNKSSFIHEGKKEKKDAGTHADMNTHKQKGVEGGGGRSAPSQKQETHAVEKNTHAHMHTYTYRHMFT